MTTPRTVAGQAAISGLRPHVKRALAGTIAAIEAEAIAPYVEVLLEADRLIAALAARDATSAWDAPTRLEIVNRAQAAHRLAEPLLLEHLRDDRG